MRGDRILYAGHRFDGHADRVIDRPGWFICPGFINLHGHIGVELMAAMVDIPRDDRFAPSPEFSRRAPLTLEPSLTPEEQLSAEFSLVQMLRCGADHRRRRRRLGADLVAGQPAGRRRSLVETVGRVGCRAYLSLAPLRPLLPVGSSATGTGTRRWAWPCCGRRCASRSATAARTTAGSRSCSTRTPSTTATPPCSRRRWPRRAADLLIQIHTAQYARVAPHPRALRRHPGRSPAQSRFLGPDIILGHCIFITGHPDVGGDPDRDLRLIADAGSSVAHSPLPFARTGEALYTLPRYLDHGITVGIGCDIWPADIIAEMRLAWFLGKHTNRTAERPTAMEVFTAATVRSADALGRAISAGWPRARWPTSSASI